MMSVCAYQTLLRRRDEEAVARIQRRREDALHERLEESAAVDTCLLMTIL